MIDVLRNVKHLRFRSCLIKRLKEATRFFFFFQAEDGIRDATVTGAQTCALPISRVHPVRADRRGHEPVLARNGEPGGRRGRLRAPFPPVRRVWTVSFVQRRAPSRWRRSEGGRSRSLIDCEPSGLPNDLEVGPGRLQGRRTALDVQSKRQRVAPFGSAVATPNAVTGVIA